VNGGFLTSQAGAQFRLCRGSNRPQEGDNRAAHVEEVHKTAESYDDLTNFVI
jgi:hypothetical protein